MTNPVYEATNSDVKKLSEREYFVLSVNHTTRDNPYIILWASDSAGYRGRTFSAGRYTHSEVMKQLGYFNNGHDTIAVPCDVVEPLTYAVRPGFFDDNNGRWLRNNAATWKVLMANVIAKPKYNPKPEYRGAPRKKEASNG